jgi:Ser/Thr protein kinase RdoA (MazF antagonist)
MNALTTVAAAVLPADLLTVVQALGAPLSEVTPVTALPARGVDRACFRLTFVDGRVLKGRQVETLEQADRLQNLIERLDRRHFPAVLERHGRAFLTEWIEGTPLHHLAWTPRILEACGGVHAALHRVAVEARPQWRSRRDPWETRMAAALRLLVDAALLDAGMAGLAEALASRFAPRAVEVGMCHGDLCAENIVVDRDGRVVVVDNDNLAVDAWGYDIARTWYRWPMTEAERRQYMAGYGRADHLAAVDAHFIHWVVVVLVEAAAYRVRVGVDGADRALGALEMVLRDPVRYARFPGLVADGACTS